MLVWNSAVEKQSSLLELCQTSPGQCYAALGISPDNIDRTNKKLHSSWLSTIEELASAPECVAIVSGLNMTREMCTHFAQESLLKSCAGIATRLALPLILHVGCDGASLDRALELLQKMGWLSDGEGLDRRIILYDALPACSGDPLKVQEIIQSGIRCMVSASGLTDPSEEYRACLNAIPLSRMVACTDSPWKTPQNLPDPYLRTLRNEPCNISAVIDAIASGIGLSSESVSLTLLQNTLRILQIPLSAEVAVDLPSLAVEPPLQKIPAEEVVRSLLQSQRYRCAKCRHLIVTSARIVTHPPPAGTSPPSRTILKMGQEGLGMCSASLFVSCAEDEAEAGNGEGFAMEKETVHCAGCRAKIGRVSFGDATCGCGTVVRGPVLRLTASKLDQFFPETDAMSTAQLSAVLSRLEEPPAGEVVDGQCEHKFKTKKKKKLRQRSENKGNVSSHRNKSFVPNASRKKKDSAAPAPPSSSPSATEDHRKKGRSKAAKHHHPQQQVGRGEEENGVLESLKPFSLPVVEEAVEEHEDEGDEEDEESSEGDDGGSEDEEEEVRISAGRGGTKKRTEVKVVVG
jgi:Tat protein secretion system quality control protein TatD with DNase activity